MLEPESISAALLAAAGEVQALMNHVGLSVRGGQPAKLSFEEDMRTSLRRALQYGRSEAVTTDTVLGTRGILGAGTDVVVASRSKTPQLAVEVQWHPRGEDHAGFAGNAMADVLKMALARGANAADQAAVLMAAPSRFWRWLPGFVDQRVGYELLTPGQDNPVSARTTFLSAPNWDFVFDGGMDRELPDRIWTSLLGTASIRTPWAETELRLLEVKGLGGLGALRPPA